MRAPFVIGATVAGVAGIIAFHPHGASNATTFNAPGTRAVGGTSSNAGATASGAPPTTGPVPSTTGPVPSTTAAPPGGSSPAPSTTTPVTSTTAASGTASGGVTQYRFGVLQVTATVSGGRLTNVSTQVQSTDPRSQQIDNAALPILRQQALSAQTANIQGVSGASYTSQAFATSLQGALSALGFKG